MRLILHRITLISFFLATVMAAKAKTRSVLVFSDGNRVTGVVAEHKWGYYKFQSDRFGMLSVSDKDATVIEETVPAGPTTAIPSFLLAPTTVSQAGTTNPPQPSWWKRNFGPWQPMVSLSFESKQDTEKRHSVMAEVRVKRIWPKDELRFASSYDYASEDKKTATDLAKGNAYWRHDFVVRGQRFFILNAPLYEYNRNYSVQNEPADYFLLKEPVGVGIALVDRGASKVRFGVAENFLDVWTWAHDRQTHDNSNIESVFAEVELDLPFGIRITDTGTCYFRINTGQNGFENLAELSKRLTQSLSLGFRHEIRARIPNTDIADYNLWRLMLNYDF